tara:strand:+ start:5998 stop:7770 length:1773 start_codon:yes stop_codon:yes gene_type:complete
MALGTPSESPAVVVKEIDLTGGVPNVQSTTGAIVGNFRWGPVGERVRVANEAELVSNFASPDSDNTIDWHSAAYFLRYSSSMLVVREATAAAKNAYSSTMQGPIKIASFSGTPTVNNETAFEAQVNSLDSDGHTFVARYPGDLGNSISVNILPAVDSAGRFTNWPFAGNFDGAPGTSPFAADVNATNDEMHVVVVDQEGLLTGTRGQVLETYPFVSAAQNATNPDGTTNFAKSVINTRSEYVYLVDFDSDMKQTAGTAAGAAAVSGSNFLINNHTNGHAYNFDSGVNSGILTTTEVLNGHDLFEDRDIVEVDFMISPSMNSRTDHTTVVNDLVTTAQSLRKDCVVCASPARTDVVGLTNAATITTNITTTAASFTNSSYLVMDGNFLKVYDKFNDQYINIPAASSTAGIMAATDLNRAPWFSPAGSRRGQYLGITALAWTPTKAQRDSLYKASVNPIANIPGQGSLLFGDKTKLGRPSAFDRINVRRLFLVLERAIGRAAEQALFEFNDEFTRAEFVNIVEPVLREVRGRRGISDFKVVCDETNNTPAIVDRNEFIANIFIKPARSINYITLNFVAVRSGVDFEEVVGTV